jgi:hypothetical protein
MRYFISICIISLASISANAQTVKRKGQHTFNLSFTPQWNLNRLNSLHRSGVDLEQQVLFPKNTVGHNFGFEYQRITRYGLVWSAGVQLSEQKHDVGVLLKLNEPDEERYYKEQLTIIDTQYTSKVRNISIRLMAGYNWQSPLGLPKGWDLLAKGGLSLRHYRDDSYNSNYWQLYYPNKDDQYSSVAGNSRQGFGSSQPFGSGFSYAFDFYTGISRELNWGIFRTISLGLEGTYMIHGGSGGVYESLYKIDPVTQDVINSSEYRYSPKDISLGIRFAVGLWPNIRGHR